MKRTNNNCAEDFFNRKLSGQTLVSVSPDGTKYTFQGTVPKTPLDKLLMGLDSK